MDMWWPIGCELVAYWLWVNGLLVVRLWFVSDDRTISGHWSHFGCKLFSSDYQLAVQYPSAMASVGPSFSEITQRPKKTVHFAENISTIHVIEEAPWRSVARKSHRPSYVPKHVDDINFTNSYRWFVLHWLQWDSSLYIWNPELFKFKLQHYMDDMEKHRRLKEMNCEGLDIVMWKRDEFNFELNEWVEREMMMHVHPRMSDMYLKMDGTIVLQSVVGRSSPWRPCPHTVLQGFNSRGQKVYRTLLHGPVFTWFACFIIIGVVVVAGMISLCRV